MAADHRCHPVHDPASGGVETLGRHRTGAGHQQAGDERGQPQALHQGWFPGTGGPPGAVWTGPGVTAPAPVDAGRRVGDVLGHRQARPTWRCRPD